MERERAGARLTGVSLDHVVLTGREPADGGAGAAPEHARFFLELQMVRTSALHLRVALELSGESGLPYDLQVVYAADFEIDRSVPPARREAEWRDVAFRRAPAILFPYVRELVATLTSRWGGAPLLLPDDPDLLDFARDAHDVPPPPTN